MWQSRRWRFLLNLIDHLPRTSFYVEAMSDDDELAAALPDIRIEHVERISQWTPEREVLAAIHDLLIGILGAQIATGGGKPPEITPFPQPSTALQRLRDRSAEEMHESLVERLTGR